MKLKKAIYVVVGCLGVGLGAVGAVVPMLPAFPFLLFFLLPSFLLSLLKSPLLSFLLL